MADSTPRKRSRAACLSCQSRKRKCSGERPCTTCVQAGVDCHYSAARARNAPVPCIIGVYLHSTSARYRMDGPITPPVSTAGSAASPVPRVNESHGVGHSLEANSGAAFVRKLGLRIDPARAPRLHLFAWNVGERRVSSAVASPITSPAPITEIISQDEMQRLAVIYFEKVDPCYAFLDRKSVFDHIVQRWSKAPTRANESREIQDYDAVLCGMAAFGLLFSQREIMPTERQLIDTAHKLLEQTMLCAQTPSVDIVTGWVLRAAYLRMTSSPHAAWMASCTLMHLIEAAGLHLDKPDPDSTGLIATPNQSGTAEANDTGRRLFGMARHLNIWISFDLGRSRVVLHGATTHLPSAPPLPSTSPSSPPSQKADLFHLLPLSESLDPTGPAPQDLPELENALSSVLSLIYTTPSLILVQCNLTLCIYRRVRAPKRPRPPNIHHFRPRTRPRGPRSPRCTRNGLCLESLASALLPDAMRTLGEVVAAYDTGVMREAYSTAYLLIALHQRRKEDDTRALADVLRANALAMAPETEEIGGVGVVPGLDMGPVSDVELSWLGDLMIDMPSLQNFDLDQFLMTDVPWPLPEMGI
ncbi:transcriptional regulator family: Fungal Specific TF [Penicillium maclennaniae]|uniref:transcriptional regulator family: Fungal Specific TF n=1 Tax=Penicillium maclennaniae TaxID=1343394 RepID=UPI00253FF078|nr:transcriptional regulator family: Fungal Specific TF [Penicillium maclennaniae]KAJ5665075.1 transcriptional regulator family: Fungal Specific TF [Penicillium maclennaniae]